MKKLFLAIFISALVSIESSFAEEMKEITIQIKDHKFIPSTVNVKANEKFKLIVENLDKTAEEFESNDLKKEKVVSGGKKITLIIAPLKAGEYPFFGEFHHETAKGVVIAK